MEQMQKECEKSGTATEGEMQTRLRRCVREMNDIKKKVKAREDTLAKLSDLHSLMHAKVNSFTLVQKDEMNHRKDQAQDRNRTLQAGVAELDEAHRASSNAHSVTLAIIGTMQDQRLQIQNTTGKLAQVKGNARVSQDYVNTMTRRDFLYRLLLLIIAILLLVLFLSLGYFKFVRYPPLPLTCSSFFR